jgi:excisionase family DNA binding protein
MSKDLTSRQAAEFLGVHIDTIRRMEKKGQLPAYKIGTGKHRRFRKKDLEKIKSDN